MVNAGYEGAVAPLGTALTEDQLALIWKMADEPILCFDGDGAGRRAAYRAIDIALPLVRPGKSLRFATLPEGQDPDDLWRSGGREAIDAVLSAARPLADMLWMRETEAASFTTPERRAALEARIGEITGAIGDETVRKYYRRDFGERLRRLFFGSDERPRPGQSQGRRPNSDWRGANKGRKPGRNGTPTGRYSSFTTRPADGPYVVASPQLAASPIMRGHRAAMPLREALILQAAINHPWLLDEHLETLEGAEFRHPDAEKVKAALIDIATHHGAAGGAADGEAVRGELSRRGIAELVERIERAITVPSVWGARPDAAPADVVMTWNQLFALHRQWHSLIKELKDAEQALGRDTTEANYTWLQDVKARLSVIEGTEALVEGFGASSGRGASGF